MNVNQPSGVPSWVVVSLAVLFLLSVAGLSYGEIRAEIEAGNSGSAIFWNMLVNSTLLAVPNFLLYFSIGVIIAAYRQKRSPAGLSPRLAKFIYRTPRIAGIVICVFVAMFALDVFDGGGSALAMIGGFIIHALPAIVLAAVLTLAWRREWIGFAIFLAAAIYFLRFLFPDPLGQFGVVLLFSAPMAVIAILFWLNWKWRSDLRPAG